MALYDFYKSKSKALPSVQERSKLFEQYGLGSATGYQGTAQQNIALESKLRSLPSSSQQPVTQPVIQQAPQAPQIQPAQQTPLPVSPGELEFLKNKYIQGGYSPEVAAQKVAEITKGRSLPQAQPSLAQVPQDMQVSPPPQPQNAFYKALQAMMQAAQGAGNEDLLAKRNAIIQARFNAGRDVTPEELRVLSPQAQAGLRGLDVRGLENQLSGVSTALQGREKRQEAQQQAAKDVLSFLKPQEVGSNIVQFNPETGKYDVVYEGEKKPGSQAAGVQEYEYYANQEKTAGRVPLTFDQYQSRDANRKQQIARITAGGLNSAQQSAAFKLVDDYEKASGDLQKQISAYNRVSASAQDPSGAGDLSLIFNYMKMLDPGSTVREGEFATAQNTGTIGDRVYNVYNKLLSGERLTDGQRKDFVSTAQRIYKSALDQQKLVDKTYTERANKFGVSPDLVVRSQTSYLDTSKQVSPQQVKDAYSKGGFDEPYENIVSKYGIEKVQEILKNKGLLSFSGVGSDTKLAVFKQSLVSQESGGNYKAVGSQTPHGSALGKYQILPKFHFAKIGLKDTPADKQKFLSSPELQDKLFDIIIGDLSSQYKGDLRKVAAAYYGGAGGASIVGTSAANKPQKAGGKTYPSINEYVSSVLSRIS